MSAPAIAGLRKPTLRIRGRSYPVLLPSIRDPRLHLAAVIVSLQVLGQVAFDFNLSIAQILVSLLTCAVLEVGIAFRRQHVILWPASALLTGNGVAFILRVPGTEHGDWWSMHGWWIFAGTAAVSLLSKYLIHFRGHHVFNPSNFGLVLCFLLLGPEHADPLEFWWGPMSPWLALAIAIIVTGGLAILLRLRLLGIAIGFWVTFVACIAVLAASGHAMTARWHLGPVSDWYFWRVLAFSPEILVFLFFMITDPKTIPSSRTGRRVYAVAIGLLAALLSAPQATEFATKVAVLSALFIVCAARPLLVLFAEAAQSRGWSSGALAAGVATRRAAALAGAVAVVSLLVVAGNPARSSAGDTLAPSTTPNELVAVSLQPAQGIAPIDNRLARQIARDVATDLQVESDALRLRDPDRATAGADGARLAAVWRQIRAGAGGPIVVPKYRVERVHVSLERGEGQDAPTVVAKVVGTVERTTYGGSPLTIQHRGAPVRLTRTFELALKRGRYLITTSRGAAEAPAPTPTRSEALDGLRLHDVAAQVGLDFKQAAFHFGMTNEPAAMMGGGLCWIDYDDDGWLDLFVVNAYADHEYVDWTESGGLPRSALFHNVHGRFEDVSSGSGADLQLRGSGCVTADFNEDGNADLFVTTVGYNAATNGYDALLWGNGDGTFTEGARPAGINTPSWHSGAAVGDVNGDGRPDLFVGGYADVNAPIPSSTAGFPSNYVGVRDRLYLNQGVDRNGRSRFREVGKRAGLEATHLDHGLGAVFTDVNEDGRLDLYVANDLDPNRLYLNVARPRNSTAGLGFHLEERARNEGLDDPNAGMGIAAADYSGDGHEDLFVTNSRRQLHAIYRSSVASSGKPAFVDARPDFVAALGKDYTGWGVSWADLDLDGNLDLVLANGAIPLVNLKNDAQRIQVLENLAGEGRPGEFADASSLVGLPPAQRINGRGLAAADYDNDGDVDVAINSIAGRLTLLQNTGAAGHWLEVKLPKFLPGTKVTAVLPDGKRLVRELHAGSSYLSSEDPRAHFGLGAATHVRELVVRFPDGGQTRRTNVAANQILSVTP
jgi:Na+-translocating ferredoxin:NAD+ oxidoreductase RnfD subunit